ncbi:MAG TPA: PBP1A family penicillin-binding protein, partial [Vicinamibacterales bacterium]|nr:PBP1A family penicillin-binding protein [Vicinamibacterales bacterium]
MSLANPFTSARAAAFLRAHPRLVVGAILVVSLAGWLAAAGAFWFVRGVLADLPPPDAIREVGRMVQATLLLDVKGHPAFTLYKEQRIEVPLSRVSPHLVRAILAVEDQRFFDHNGLDVIRVAGAALTNLREGRVVQGGSTITQQLARQSFLSSEKTLRRKLAEIIVAARLEKQFSKQQILEFYLNKVYFGDGLYGIEAASLGYFGKHASELDVAEAALLAGLVKSPSTYAPTVDRERAVERRNVVLQAMHDAGAIDEATYRDAVRAPVVLRDGLRKDEAYGPYFKEEVRRELVRRFGWERVYQGGLRVYTTMDPELQKAAEAEVARALEEIERRRGRPSLEAVQGDQVLQAALVAMDPRTGEVRALVGGRDFAQSSFNRATQARRQAGSAFKPFVYAAALERGYSPASVLRNLDEPTMTYEGAWVPEDEHSTAASMTMRTALRTSSNRAAVRMLQEIGIPAAVHAAERLGVGTMPAVPSLALGAGEVTLIDMTAAFAAFANRGMRPTPTLIRRVETLDGAVLYSGPEPAHRAVSETTAFLMTTMLADVVDAGTAWQARRVGFTLPAAGKTGTTNEYRDAWFVGYTPKLIAGVWVGYDRPQTIMRNGYAAQLAVPLWGRFMKAATRAHDPEWFRPPPGITSASICWVSGRLATPACRNAPTVDVNGGVAIGSTVYTEYFLRGTEPAEYCDVHGFAHGPFETVTAAEDDDDRPLPSHVPSGGTARGRRGRLFPHLAGRSVGRAAQGAAAAAPELLASSLRIRARRRRRRSRPQPWGCRQGVPQAAGPDAVSCSCPPARSRRRADMSFRHIVGHTRLLSLLSRAVARGTLPPALLLSGPAGVGKRRAALAIARALNCLEPWSNSLAGEEAVAPSGSGDGGLPGSAVPEERAESARAAMPAGRSAVPFERDGCGACAACRRIERGLHPDVVVVEPGETGSIRIDQVRDVIERAGYRPFEGSRRVVIIDEADAMMAAAQHALLKTLEEPPSSSLFVLVSSMPDALLATVRSRCPRLRFGPLSPAEVAEVLIRDHGYTAAEAHAAAASAGGSVGSALSAEAANVAEAREAARRLLEQTSRASDPVRRLEAARDLAVKKGTAAAER